MISARARKKNRLWKGETAILDGEVGEVLSKEETFEERSEGVSREGRQKEQ